MNQGLRERSSGLAADDQTVKLFSYVVARDYGFAPNPFYGFCTLCTCKPVIRRVALVGDWIVGTGSKTRNRQNQVVFAMRVTEALTLAEYWYDPRFTNKRPNLHGSKKQAFGDNIYHRNSSDNWAQENSHHSHQDGTQNLRNIVNDTQTDRVLISDDYVYFGGTGPEIPTRFTHADNDIRARLGHRSNFPAWFIDDVVSWIRGLEVAGYVDEPLDWVRTP